ncbi:MAG: response regulator [Desulfobacterales bacterium]
MAYRILVVDDEELIRQVIQDHLEKIGYEIDSADSFKSAISLVQANEYNIIITDKNMPHPDGTHESGMSLLEFVSKHYPHIEVLMMTGYPTPDTAAGSIKMGAFDYLAKPFSMAELQSKIERILEYQSYIDPEEIMPIYKTFQNEILFLFNNKDKLTKDEFSRSIDSINEKIDYFFRSQNKLLERNLRQREVLDRIISSSRKLQQNASDPQLVTDLIDTIMNEADYPPL